MWPHSQICVSYDDRIHVATFSNLRTDDEEAHVWVIDRVFDGLIGGDVFPQRRCTRVRGVRLGDLCLCLLVICGHRDREGHYTGGAQCVPQIARLSARWRRRRPREKGYRSLTVALARTHVHIAKQNIGEGDRARTIVCDDVDRFCRSRLRRQRCAPGPCCRGHSASAPQKGSSLLLWALFRDRDCDSRAWLGVPPHGCGVGSAL
eukprot:COSAG01_NODE_3834_length_5650_cov_4.421005_2_plen_205_part_00